MPTEAIGVDLCDITRLQNILQRFDQRFIKKVFTATEQKYCNGRKDRAACFAARFAAKEALLKALGTGLRDGLTWKDMEVVNDELGKPFFNCHGRAAEMLGGRTVLLSLSHTDQNALAMVVIRS